MQIVSQLIRSDGESENEKSSIEFLRLARFCQNESAKSKRTKFNKTRILTEIRTPKNTGIVSLDGIQK